MITKRIENFNQTAGLWIHIAVRRALMNSDTLELEGHEIQKIITWLKGTYKREDNQSLA